MIVCCELRFRATTNNQAHTKSLQVYSSIMSSEQPPAAAGEESNNNMNNQQQQQQKRKEQLEQERQAAAQQLEQILSTSRPKNLVQGVSRGVSNIVAGAVGGAGVAVILPVAGLAAGLQAGGLLGGVVGVAGGAVAGALGGAALAVAGAVSGVAQVTRGVAAVPQSLLAPRQGKWWNERTGQWVLTDMTVEAERWQGIPEDDADILGKVQQEIDDSIEFTTTAGAVKDMTYYNSLEIPATAEPAVIKRQYYLLARKYHPDKQKDGDDTQQAADKFKEIAEAYQVLSDPTLRQRYDKEGPQGLSPDKTSTAGSGDGKPPVDPALLFAFLFGSDLFYDYIGRLSTATSASVGDSPKIDWKDAQTLQQRRVTRLAVKLIAKITPWVEQSGEGSLENDHTNIEALWQAEAVELSKASFGYPLVTTIGKVRVCEFCLFL